MIQIDIPMPEKCADCPCYNNAVYGQCKVTDRWFGAADGAWFDARPNWCPLREVSNEMPKV